MQRRFFALALAALKANGRCDAHHCPLFDAELECVSGKRVSTKIGVSHAVAHCNLHSLRFSLHYRSFQCRGSSNAAGRVTECGAACAWTKDGGKWVASTARAAATTAWARATTAWAKAATQCAVAIGSVIGVYELVKEEFAPDKAGSEPVQNKEDHCSRLRASKAVTPSV